jgi:hypothetical protein
MQLTSLPTIKVCSNVLLRVCTLLLMHKKLAVNLQFFWALTLNCQTSFKVFDVPGFAVNSSYKQE